MTTPRIEEMVEEFTQYCNDGYNGGKDGLRCSECDRKYRGEAQIKQLCPVCNARTALTQAHQAGIDEAVEVVKKMQIQKPERKGSEFSTPRDYHWRGYYTALDDTIKALQDNK